MLENKERRPNNSLLIYCTYYNNYFQFSIDVSRSLILVENIFVPSNKFRNKFRNKLSLAENVRKKKEEEEEGQSESMFLRRYR